MIKINRKSLLVIKIEEEKIIEGIKTNMLKAKDFIAYLLKFERITNGTNKTIENTSINDLFFDNKKIREVKIDPYMNEIFIKN